MVRVRKVDLYKWEIESPGGSLKMLLAKERHPYIGTIWWVRLSSGGWVTLEILERMLDTAKQIANDEVTE